MINLLEFTEDDHPFGNAQGKETFRKLSDYVDHHLSQKVFEITLKDIAATDSSFPRESVVSLVRHYSGDRGFFLTGFKSQDLLDNWSYAAEAKGQLLIVLNDNGEHLLLGNKANSSISSLLDYIFSKGIVTTSKVADKFNLSPQNASGKLKKLLNQGLIVGSKEVAESGGLEYVYSAIR
ncbi:MAG: hypothetical protein JKY22_00280 [Flavobacteriaceae bacterium]|nr:hypothetical protein [Flavobacteriaceae bacterium]